MKKFLLKLLMKIPIIGRKTFFSFLNKGKYLNLIKYIGNTELKIDDLDYLVKMPNKSVHLLSSLLAKSRLEKFSSLLIDCKIHDKKNPHLVFAIAFGNYGDEIQFIVKQKCFTGMYLDSVRVQYHYESYEDLPKYWFKVDEKSWNDIPSLLIKMSNLSERFKDVITKFSIIPLNANNEKLDFISTATSLGYSVKYNLVGEEKQFECYYRNNELKKKLKGALISIASVEANLQSMVAQINDIFKAKKKNIVFSLEQSKRSHNKLCYFINTELFMEIDLNDANSLKTAQDPLLLKKFSMISSKPLYEIIVDGKPMIVTSPSVDENGIMKFIPIFAKNGNSIIATAIRGRSLNISE